MKKKTALVLAMAVLFIAMRSAGAHPPSAIDATYDAKRGELNVTVEHPVTKPTEHFINEVVVTKNGSEAAKKTFDSQTSHRNQTMPPIKFDAKPGDTVSVKATCNLFGAKTVAVDLSTPSK